MDDKKCKCIVSSNTNVVKIIYQKPKSEQNNFIENKRSSSDNIQKSSGRWTKEEHLAFVKGMIFYCINL